MAELMEDAVVTCIVRLEKFIYGKIAGAMHMCISDGSQPVVGHLLGKHVPKHVTL